MCLSFAALATAVSAAPLAGFDEVWLFTARPPDFDLYDVSSASSDARLFSEDGVPPDLLQAMSRSGAMAALGDGCGLNYAVADKRLTEVIVREAEHEN